MLKDSWMKTFKILSKSFFQKLINRCLVYFVPFMLCNPKLRSCWSNFTSELPRLSCSISENYLQYLKYQEVLLEVLKFNTKWVLERRTKLLSLALRMIKLCSSKISKFYSDPDEDAVEAENEVRGSTRKSLEHQKCFSLFDFYVKQFTKRCNWLWKLSANPMTRLKLIIHSQYRLTSVPRCSQEAREKHVKVFKYSVSKFSITREKLPIEARWEISQIVRRRECFCFMNKSVKRKLMIIWWACRELNCGIFSAHFSFSWLMIILSKKLFDIYVDLESNSCSVQLHSMVKQSMNEI